MGQKYARLDQVGRVIGFYDSEIHGAAVPAGAVPISDAVYEAWKGDTLHQRWDGQALVPYVPAVTLDQARAVAKRMARAELDARITAGMAWADGVVQIDEASQIRLAAAAQLAALGSLPAAFEWRMADNSAMALDAAGMLAMATAAGEHVYAMRAWYWALVDAVMAAGTAEAVKAIDVTVGWPA